MSDDYSVPVSNPEDSSAPVDPESAPETSPSDPNRPKWAPWVILAGVVALLIAGFLILRTPTVETPKVVGMSAASAEKALTAAGLQTGAVSEVETLAAAPGTVVAQKPQAGEQAKEGSRVDLSVAVLPVVTVPDVVGKEVSEANELIAGEGLRPGDITYSYSETVKPGEVMAQDPAASSEASVGAFVNLEVSKGEKQSQVPNVVGLSQSDAEDVLAADGFEVKTAKAESKSVPAGDVISQSPAAGVVTDQGSTVTITVSTGAPAEPSEPATPSAGGGDQSGGSNDQSGGSGDQSDNADKPNNPDQGTDGEKPSNPETPTAPPSTAVAVPDVVGMRILEGIRALKAAKLKIDFAFAASADYVLKIAAQDPKAGTQVDRGSVVTVTIGLPEFLFSLEKPSTLPAPASTGATSTTPPTVESSETTGQ